ncbi:putative Diguanylate cyclase/phosphodiesterase with PAS/PAC domain [Candidatus Terasakiella magnetica]|nr:putative Diguanylate cyclase/phosphodiesterase with PAS/PAC domain [Candidatus Terasakiella magnetica]
MSAGESRDGDTSVQCLALPGVGSPAASSAEVLHRHSIGMRLLILIALFSTLITLASTALQLYFDYSRDVQAIETRLDEIERSYLDSIAAGLWSFNTPQLKLQMNGILSLPEMRAVEVRENGKGGQKGLVLAVGQRQARAAIIREIPITLTTQGNVRPLGTLTLEATLDVVYQRLIDTAVIILISQGIQTFLVSMFIFFIVHRLVTRHLMSIAHFLSWHDTRSAPPLLTLERNHPSQPDELEHMVDAFNTMSGDLYSAYCELSGVNTALERDIAIRQSYEEQLYRQAHYDELTGLPNRVLTIDRLDQAIAVANREKALSALLLIDLDNFKDVNDAIGHGAGDRLLKEAAQRLGTCIREGDTLARMGGDEFVIVLPNIADSFVVQKVAERVLDAFQPPFHLDGQDHFVSASLGIALFPSDGTSPEDLLRNADLALYKAKEQGRARYQFFTPEINERTQLRLALARRLRGATARGEFVLYYQPLFHAATGTPATFEALIRWRQPDGSIIMPGQFITLAEDIGLIGEIGDWVLETACREAAALFKESREELRIAVNVSPRQLHSGEFGRKVRRVLDDTGLPPQRLEVEITESMLMDDTSETIIALEMLCDLGVRLSIDDFGTGYSSLGYLHRYPFNTLKIDRSFVIKIEKDRNGARLVETITGMARGLGMETIAEGVETEGQRDFLRKHNCDILQGYLLGRPAPFATAQALLKDTATVV